MTSSRDQSVTRTMHTAVHAGCEWRLAVVWPLRLKALTAGVLDHRCCRTSTAFASRVSCVALPASGLRKRRYSGRLQCVGTTDPRRCMSHFAPAGYLYGLSRTCWN